MPFAIRHSLFATPGLALLVSMLAQAAPASMTWESLPPLPDTEGFAGAFAGVSHGTLLVAGGANFPAGKPWEGGTKVWHDTVLALPEPAGRWKVAGKLPRPLGYGVSATWRQSLICAGGSDAQGPRAEVFAIELNQETVQHRPLPPLPLPLANAAGTRVGETLYVCGGSDQPGERTALKRLFSLDLAASDLAWKEREPCPGPPRILATAAAVDGAFLLIGGAALETHATGVRRVYLRDAWQYRPAQGWRQLADLPTPRAAAASPAPVHGSHCFLLGGDDGSLAGFQPLARHPGFPGVPLAWDAARNQWTPAAEIPVVRVTLTTTLWHGRWVLPSGEIRPGVRSPEVWSVAFTP